MKPYTSKHKKSATLYTLMSSMMILTLTMILMAMCILSSEDSLVMLICRTCRQLTMNPWQKKKAQGVATVGHSSIPTS